MLSQELQKGSAKGNYGVNVWYLFKIVSQSIDPYSAVHNSFEITHPADFFIIRKLNDHIQILRRT